MQKLHLKKIPRLVLSPNPSYVKIWVKIGSKLVIIRGGALKAPPCHSGCISEATTCRVIKRFQTTAKNAQMEGLNQEYPQPHGLL